MRPESRRSRQRLSSLVGSPTNRLSLAAAVDALADAARRAGRPGPLWLAGIFYPSLNLNVELVRGVLALVHRLSGIELPGAGDVGPLVTLFAPRVLVSLDGGRIIGYLVLLPLWLVVYRLIVGLAKVSHPQLAEASGGAGREGSTTATPEPDRMLRCRPGSLRRVWSEGRGLALVAFGLWAMLLSLLLGAMLILIGPVVALLKVLGLAEFSALFAGLLLPALLLILAYACVLMVLNQLALHSLAHNRRGVASALTHAWRLVHASPMSALRATLVDLLLFVSVLAAEWLLAGLLIGLPPFRWLASLLVLGLYGFAGVARAGFWARTYRALGGLSALDRVPGLVPAAER
jgi:hypothetical protein